MIESMESTNEKIRVKSRNNKNEKELSVVENKRLCHEMLINHKLFPILNLD